MGKMLNDFYKENFGYVEDIQEYYKKIKQELSYIVKEVSGHTLECDNFYIGMIPFEQHINGILVEDTKFLEFECDDIRDEIGSGYGNQPPNIIRRFGGMGENKARDLIRSKIINTYCDCIFVSSWIEFGPFLIFLVAKMNEETYLSYKNLADTKEESDNEYKYFLNTLINNFYEKWLECIYYGLNHSTIDYISDSQAIITASANDMFESRDLPFEHFFTKIANYEYEGAPCKGKIVFTDQVDKIVSFKQPIGISIDNVKKIRKMLEMSNDNTCLIATLSGKKIIGLGDFSNYKESYLLEFKDVNTWDFSLAGKHIVKYINGQYRLPENKFNEEILLKKCEERFKGGYDKKIVKIIEAASCQKHGTMVIISSTAKEESKNIVKNNKGTAIDEIDLTDQSKDVILGLSSIDGALMIDPRGKCSGIGLILSNTSSEKGNPERGARYNSALNYINEKKESIAVVVSEDGMIDIL